MRRIVSAFVAAALLVGAEAAAQTLPGPAEPRADIPLPEAPGLDPSAFDVSVPERGAVAPRFLQESFPLAGLRITGNSVYATDVLRDLFPVSLPGVVTLGDLFAFEDAITRKYRDEGGYQLTFALIPPQDISDGQLLIEVFEGYVERIEVRGESRRLRERVRAMLAPVAGQRPMRGATLEERMLLVDDIPGLAVTGTLRPAESGARAASDFFVEVENTPLTMFTSFDNRGSEYAGYTRVRTLLTIASPGGFPVTVRAFGDIAVPVEEKHNGVIELEYAAPWGGTTVSALHARSFARVGGRLRETAESRADGRKLSDFRTEGVSTRLGVTQSLLRSRAHRLTGGLTLERSGSLSTESGEEIFNDRQTTLEASLAYTYRDAPLIGGTGRIRLSARHGLDAAGASREGGDRVSRRDGEVDFTRFNIDLAHRWTFGHGIEFDIRAAGQRATTHLLSGQEFGIGGGRYGRAYDFNEYKGEHGFGAAAELRKTIRFDPQWAPDIQLYGFYDIAQVWDTDQAGGPDSQPSIASTGFGARVIAEPVRGGPRFTLFGEKAIPLTRKPARVYADGLRSRYIIGGSLSVALDE